MRYRQNSLAAHAQAPLLDAGLEESLADVGVRLGDAVRVQQADGVPRVRAQAPVDEETYFALICIQGADFDHIF